MRMAIRLWVGRSVRLGVLERAGFFFVLLFLSMPLAQADEGALRLQRTADGAEVAARDAETALTSGGLAIRLPAGGGFNLYGLPVTSDGGAYLFITASSEFVIFAGLEGVADIDGMTVKPGYAAVLAIATGKQTRKEFDAERLAASAGPGVAAEFNRALAPVVSSQRKVRRMGRYEPARLNAQQPVAAGYETVRRDYLLDPTIIRLRKDAGGDKSALPQLVAERFVAALANADAAGVAALLDPAPFAAAGDGWRAARAGYAAELIRSGMAAKLAEAAVRRADAPGAFTVKSPAGDWELTTVERDVVVFVSALKTLP